MAARYEFARPQTNVDVLLFTVPDFWRAGATGPPRLEISLLTRDRPPFEGQLALPGTVIKDFSKQIRS